jgi:hypothetical protein
VNSLGHGRLVIRLIDDDPHEPRAEALGQLGVPAQMWPYPPRPDFEVDALRLRLGRKHVELALAERVQRKVVSELHQAQAE